MQRITAVALVPLLLWFVASVCVMTGADFDQARNWVAHPLVSLLLILMVGAGFHHMQLGLQVVLEDYVQTAWIRVASIVAVKFVTIALGVAAVLSILKIAVDV